MEVLIFIAVTLLGSIIYTSIKLFFASFSFWIKFSQAILYVTYTFSNFAKYPLKIYAPWLRHFITFLIPFAFTAFIPASWFLQDNTLLWALGGTALAAAGTATLALFTWQQGIKAYESSVKCRGN
jgi:ABC-2 type transport system permease protein